jgi:5-methylcytosine-specific restriction endonuclease McrA
MYQCSICDKIRQIKMSNEREKICVVCYEKERRPQRKCIMCGKVKRPGKLLENGPLCISCYDAQPERKVIRFEAYCKRKSKDPFELSPDEWYKLMKEFGWKCFYCENSVSGKNRTVDHIVPIFKGGITEYKNLIPACRMCNGRKGTKDFMKWAGEINLSRSKIQYVLKRLGHEKIKKKIRS